MSNNGKPVSTAEAFFLLKNNKDKYNNRRIKSHDIFLQTLEYSEATKKIDDLNALENLTNFLYALGFTTEEAAQYINLLPFFVIEIKILIPSLSRLTDAILESAINKAKETVFV